MTKQFGIIGYPLEHSFSAQHFNEKFVREGIDAYYEVYPLLSITEFPALVRQKDFLGFNVTYPYKESIIPYLDALDDTAQAIGAVNVIAYKNGQWIGHNTDMLGFMQSCPKEYKSALILGTGGAAKAVAYALNKLDIAYLFVSRASKKGLTYEQINEAILAEHQLIINCTPLGMYPNMENYPPIPYHLLTTHHFLYDVIYNPAKTRFLASGEKYGARTQNGLKMLYEQADAAWNIWGNSI